MEMCTITVYSENCVSRTIVTISCKNTDQLVSSHYQFEFGCVELFLELSDGLAVALALSLQSLNLAHQMNRLC